jgi:mannose-6-phosphate isomerase-like protein (cupin superfamily)
MPHTIFLAVLLATAPIFAQMNTPTVHTAADLKAIEAKALVAAKASPTGAGNVPIDDFGTYTSHIIVRVKSGEAELHEHWADQIIMQKGTITVVTGGTIVGGHPVPNQPGETRGTSIQGGTEITLHAGDIVHIPANLPHWVKLAPGTTTTYIVFKEK